MKIETECKARIEIELPLNTDIQTVSVTTNKEEYKRIGIIQSYRQKNAEDAENLIIEIADKINKALKETT